MHHRLSLAVLALALVACDSDDGKPDPLADKTRAFVTYNLGLATGYVDYAAERRPHLVNLINALDADVLCLQEVWTQADVDAVIAGTSANFPYNHYAMLEDKTTGPPACGDTESEPLLACIDAECQGVASSEIAGCVLSKCRTEFDALSTECRSCLVANIGKEITEIVAICKAGSPKFTYDGANGLLVLSRAKIENPRHDKIDSTLVQRSVLGVTVELPVLGKVAFACTHIAADLTSSGVPYTGPYTNWEGENKFQAEKVRDFMASYGAGAALRVATGDYNSGPPFPPDVAAEIPAAGFAVMSDAGYLAYPSAVGDASGQFCTFCAANTLVSDDSTSVQIDHVFVSAVPAGHSAKVSRVGPDIITVTRQDGSTVATHPSDHFGVVLTFTK
jgi:endonuclease/exonuclease/phosphatase family metal-dependent hydrolase